MIQYIPIGKITKPHALKGALKIRPYNLNTDFFNWAKNIYIFDNGGYINFDLTSISIQKNLFIVKIKQITGINDAEKLRGKEIFVKRDDIPIDNDEILLIDLIGYKTIFENNQFGEVISFADYGAGDLFIVKLLNNDDDIMLPYQDQFIEKIDYDEKYIIFKDIEELL